MFIGIQKEGKKIKMKLKKTRKSRKQRGNNTHGHGARKKWKGKGHHGGKGMAGTGKRADQKKTLVTKLYGNKYFGKQGVTSKKTRKKKYKVMSLENIQKNLNNLIKKYGDGKEELKLNNYKIIGDIELKTKLSITAKAFSKKAREMIEKAGGKALVVGKKDMEEGR
ncbi:hypothetical protein GF386_00745 [Candidatus Pacearchaeota archaeon]|nr:hypothetical protein [Candidatus Pacearchaeota archaeon]MBD3282786.1 hypothetical protein [Candidatus Pacearchaeota archaeon]